MTVVTDVSMDGTSEPYQEYRSATQQLSALKERYQKAEEVATAVEQLHTFLHCKNYGVNCCPHTHTSIGVVNTLSLKVCQSHFRKCV